MRGDDRQPQSMFSYVSPETRVTQDHPLRAVRSMVDEVLREMSPEFDRLYAAVGRPSVPPERLLRALLLQLFYTVRSERLLMEQLDYNILFRWFVGLEMDEPVWTPTVFTKNRERLLTQDVALSFFRRVVAQARPYMSDEHFTVDGTLVEAWAGHKGFQPKDGPPSATPQDFRGQRRYNDTHASTTDPDAKLYRRTHHGEARLSYLGHILVENRHALIVEPMATTADGTAERDAALLMLSDQSRTQPRRRRRRRRSVGADKAYDQADFAQASRALGVTPHVTQHPNRPGGSHLDARTTRHRGYRMSQHARPRVERVFGWLKRIAGLHKVKVRGLAKVDTALIFASAAYNLRRLVTLTRATA
jgi:transposase